MYNLTLYFVVMENIFLADLKPHEKVMKDMDLNRYVIVSKSIREKILYQLESDSIFMRDLGVMDYSLLLGIYYMKIAPNPPRDSRGFLSRPKSHPSKSGGNTEGKEPENLLSDFHGGVRAQIIEGPGIYYIGMIDMLQEWNWTKKMEYYFKTWVLRQPVAGISCVEPYYYQQRFMAHMRRIIITDEEFLDFNSIDTGMFRPQFVLQYPASEIVEDAFRSARSSIVADKDETKSNEPESPTYTAQKEVVNYSLQTQTQTQTQTHGPFSNSSVPIPMATDRSHVHANEAVSLSLRGTHRLHRRSSAGNPSDVQSRTASVPIPDAKIQRSMMSSRKGMEESKNKWSPLLFPKEPLHSQYKPVVIVATATATAAAAAEQDKKENIAHFDSRNVVHFDASSLTTDAKSHEDYDIVSKEDVADVIQSKHDQEQEDDEPELASSDPLVTIDAPNHPVTNTKTKNDKRLYK
ncbi:phosphatidylinositol-4-phosphate 5-kinase [Reticulomyxa filosa]|uniref:Phosphatidylinositol-4-phosphate 5-kinase n=1 Tax=Reticulomyxa filosa TaxID=46433 RepID=X6NJF7_RETFI|nr:phosphatidylinositol-4-phosphate 5-kinase [Reticulomyxa filosa]|eukprot:ETO26053.1 phosphatidylinositol-4-phosphate 5-kinase [Reticulomyxa filosa]